jgi:hypothetical protein
MLILITGNPIDGFSFYGPFKCITDLEEAANTLHTGEEWWIGKLNSTEELKG